MEQAEGKVRPRRGGYVAVRLSGHDGKPDCYTLRRIVRVRRDGVVSHVCAEHEWCKGTAKADGGTTLSYQWVKQVLILGEHQHDELGALAEGSVYTGSYHDIGRLKTAIRQAATANGGPAG